MKQREIKFRAWNKIWDTWIEVTVIEWKEFRTGRFPVYIRGYSGNKEYQTDGDLINDTVLLEWSDWKDKNNNEIYEGDICSQHDDSDRYVVVKDKLGWRKNYIQALSDYNKKGFDMMSCYDGEISEIIGNIYENPELLCNSSRKTSTK